MSRCCDSGNATGVSIIVLTLSRFLLTLFGRAEICVERKLQRDPKRQTRRDVRQMRTRTRTDAESAKGEWKFIKLRSNCPERSRSNWKKSGFQIIDSVRVSNSRLDISPPWNITATLNPALWRLFSFGCLVGRFIGDKTISSRNRKSAISDGITAIMAQPW